MNSQHMNKHTGRQLHASEVIRMAQENEIANYKALAEYLKKSTFLVSNMYKHQASKYQKI